MSRKTVPLAALALVLAAAARAQEPAAASGDAEAEVKTLVREALEKNPEVAAARRVADAANARVAAAGALPDPMLSVTYENDGASPSLGVEPMSRLSFMAQQAFPYPGKLALSRTVAALDARRAAVRPERVALALEGAVRRAYADLLEAREGIRLTDEQVATWRDIEEGIRARYSAGMGTQQDVLRAQGERTRLLQQRRRDEAAERSALAALRQLLDRPADSPLPTERRLVPVSVLALPSAAEARARALEATPELKEAAVGVERARRAAELARRDLKPDFVASAAYMNRGGLPLMWSAGVGVSVPLWSRSKQRPRIVEAETLGEAAAATEAALRRQAEARAEERLIRMEQLAAEVKLDAEGLLVQDRLSLEAALASYRTGAVPFVTALEALGTYFVDRRAAIARLAGFLRAEADLLELSLDRGTGAAMPSPAPIGASAPSM